MPPTIKASYVPVFIVAALGAGWGSAADPTMDWLMGRAATAPTTRAADDAAPTSRPAEVLVEPRRIDGRVGRVILSDGTEIVGVVTTTPGKPIRLWDEAETSYKDVPLNLIASMGARMLWERLQPEWHFIDSGSDIKEYTGKFYPARELTYELTLVNRQTLTGGVVAPLYVETDAGKRLWVINKRQKGAVGDTLAQLPYVKEVRFDAPATRPATGPK